MKTISKWVLAIFVFTLVNTGCNKEQTGSNKASVPLQQNQIFRDFVANDFLAKLNFAIYTTSVLNQEKFSRFKIELGNATESNALDVFSKFNLRESVIKHYVNNHVVNRVKLLKELPDLVNLSENELEAMVNNNYSIVSNQIVQKSTKKLNKKETLSQTNSTKNQKSGINTVFNFQNESYFYADFEGDIIEESLTEDQAIDAIMNQINSLNIAHEITGGEFLNCFGKAMGFGFGGMAGISAFYKSVSTLPIQELVLASTKWAIKRLGWFGLAISLYTLTDCLVNAY